LLKKLAFRTDVQKATSKIHLFYSKNMHKIMKQINLIVAFSGNFTQSFFILIFLKNKNQLSFFIK